MKNTVDCPINKIINPFGAPVFYKEETESTMTDAREITKKALAEESRVLSGTTAVTGFQKNGRGRLPARKWLSKAGENLICTSIFNAPAPQPFTLRVGLSVSRTFDHFIRDTGELTQVKWPNDVLFQGKKMSGILCESDGKFVYAGTGLNVSQKEFPSEINNKASSLALILENMDKKAPSVWEVLEILLQELKNMSDETYSWEKEMEKKLYKRNERIFFVPGAASIASSKEKFANQEEGILRGIDKSGGLIMETEEGLKTFYSGEIRFL